MQIILFFISWIRCSQMSSTCRHSVLFWRHVLNFTQRSTSRTLSFLSLTDSPTLLTGRMAQAFQMRSSCLKSSLNRSHRSSRWDYLIDWIFYDNSQIFAWLDLDKNVYLVYKYLKWERCDSRFLFYFNSLVLICQWKIQSVFKCLWLTWHRNATPMRLNMLIKSCRILLKFSRSWT